MIIINITKLLIIESNKFILPLELILMEYIIRHTYLLINKIQNYLNSINNKLKITNHIYIPLPR